MSGGPVTPSFAAALIAGGQSRRMGRDKAWLDWHGEPLWQIQLRKLIEVMPAAVFVSCREEQGLSSPHAEMVFDPPGNQSPLPALARCLERAQRPLLTLAVDMPQVTVSLLHELLTQKAELPMGAVFRGEHGYEPLCALYPFEVLPALQRSLAGGNLRMQDFVEEVACGGLLRVIPLSKEREAHFLNLNTPADLA